MKCPNDQTEMEKGFFDSAHWFSGEKPTMMKIFNIARKARYVVAWKCSKCQKIELYAEEKK